MTEEPDGDRESDPRGPGPERIRSIAVHRDDVANALEATLRTDREVVLRVTPPYSGRMRARLHALDADAPGGDTDESDGPPAPVHVDPRDLVGEIPPYPEVDDTAAAHPDADVEARRGLHARAVESWRERVRASVVDSVRIDAHAQDDGDERNGGTHEVDVTALG
ncbi:MAG: hypothetical protein R6U01_13955 [Halorubrum sp.]|uniref:hypothetical protein n=1 Tax=Halorubrum sp. TaxID=1879286 RepID=UPI003970BE75